MRVVGSGRGEMERMSIMLRLKMTKIALKGVGGGGVGPALIQELLTIAKWAKFDMQACSVLKIIIIK